ncbi:MAG: hypothetical protein N3A54_06040, partial [Patescibacteria group bacterium]|nr:hypothetical protein [Patescibacteria group bacterium]
FHFHIVGKRTEISRLYFSSWNQKSYATLYESYSDRQVVELYEEAYQETVLLAEITKPSEQAFKAIISPHKRGGAILFFTEPVGRQEYDNLAFLRRHNLIPTEEENKKLYDVLKIHKQQLPPEWSEQLSHWRALQLPNDPLQAATFIARLHQTAGFTSMIQCDIPKTSPELADTGTHQFWQTVCNLL